MAEGRRKWSTDEIIAALRETHGLVSIAAKYIGCSARTIYRRAQEVKEVQRVIDECREELVDRAELALWKHVTEGAPWAVALVLKTLGRHRGYVERQEIATADAEIVLRWPDDLEE
jgi:hypothetical protein